MSASRILHTICVLTVIAGPFALTTGVCAQDLVLSNRQVLVYSVPENPTSENLSATAQVVAAELVAGGLREMVGLVATQLAGNIAGVLFSVIQQTPTVGASRQLDFEIVPNDHLRGYQDFSLSIVFQQGQLLRGLSAILERREGFFRWVTIDSRELLSDAEVARLPWQSLIILQQPMTAPNELGTYRVTVAGVRKDMRVVQVHH